GEDAVVTVVDAVHVNGVSMVDVRRVERLGDDIDKTRKGVEYEHPRAAVRVNALKMHPTVLQDKVVASHVTRTGLAITRDGVPVPVEYVAFDLYIAAVGGDDPVASRMTAPVEAVLGAGMLVVVEVVVVHPHVPGVVLHRVLVEPTQVGGVVGVVAVMC